MLASVNLVMVLCLVSAVVSYRCDRSPEGIVTPKNPSDNRFQLKVSGSPEKYVPGEGYTISLVGQRLPGHGQVAQKFIGFSLVVEPQSHTLLAVKSPRDITPRPVGTFTLFGDSMTKFSTTCPNMVTHTSSMPKAEVQIRWTAPPPGSGCIIFRATVIEHRDVWYQDDGSLSKMLCEEVQENLDTQPEVMNHCCACNEAKFEVTFEGLWSRHTHPKDFPSNSWLTRFSDIIGASHSPNYKFWEYGGFATEGLRQVAERGSTRVLESELKSHSSEIRTIIKARGISYPNVTGKTFAVFRVNRHHHLMSLVSMIDPSPDWIVGVSALELCLKNCSWVEGTTLNLYPWDAGTDSGLTYISPDLQTFPREKIRRITTSFPNDPKSPFYDSSGADMKPLARLYLTRQRLYEKTCDETSDTFEGCELTEWSKWGACTATCGPGTQQRRRAFRHSNRKCPTAKFIDTRPCVARLCRPTAKMFGDEKEDPNCDIQDWADWSRCEPTDSSCKQGVQRRYRVVKPKGHAKYCLKIPIMEEKNCQPNMHPSTCPKNVRGQVLYKDPQNSTCCEENKNDGGKEDGENQYGDAENNETTERDLSEETEQDNVHGDHADGDNVNDNNGNKGEKEGNTKGNKDDGGELVEGNQETEGNNVEGDPEQAGNEEINREQDTHDEIKGEDNEQVKVNSDKEEHGEGNSKEINSEPKENDTDYDDHPDEEENVTEVEEPSGECAMTIWSRWTPCSVTCGVGERSRTRNLKHPPKGPHAEHQRAPVLKETDYGAYDDEEAAVEFAPEPCSRYRILEVKKCNGTYQSCQFSSDEAKEVEEDQTTTEEPNGDEEDLKPLGHIVDMPPHTLEGTERPVRDCKFSRWSHWSECNAPCNKPGIKERTRHIEVHAKNGGRACNGKTTKHRKCVRTCNNEGDGEGSGENNNERCKYGEWSSWTQCTATCGISSIRQRARKVLIGNPLECFERIDKERCNVAACPP